MAVDHYENFPVASLLLPRRLRPAVQAIYQFARTADDIADEGDAAPAERLAQLADYRQALHAMQGGEQPLAADHPRAALFYRLEQVIRRYQLPVKPFTDLLSAFEQDVTTTRYADDEALLDYCRRSANPVGRLMLHLYGAAGLQNLRDSDAICTGLQLANFWQDVAIDWQKQRIYIPQARMLAFGIEEQDIGHAVQGSRPAPGWAPLMREQVAGARRLLLDGAPLARRLGGRIGIELRLVVLGGLRILERLDELNYDVFGNRPVLGKADWARLAWRTLRFDRYTHSLEHRTPTL